MNNILQYSHVKHRQDKIQVMNYILLNIKEKDIFEREQNNYLEIEMIGSLVILCCFIKYYNIM